MSSYCSIYNTGNVPGDVAGIKYIKRDKYCFGSFFICLARQVFPGIGYSLGACNAIKNGAWFVVVVLFLFFFGGVKCLQMFNITE